MLEWIQSHRAEMDTGTREEFDETSLSRLCSQGLFILCLRQVLPEKVSKNYHNASESVVVVVVLLLLLLLLLDVVVVLVVVVVVVVIVVRIVVVVLSFPPREPSTGSVSRDT